MESWQALGGLGVVRSATVIIVALLIILLAFGCAPKRPPGPPSSGKVIVAAGDIADCSSDGDEATARLVSSIEGTVLTLGDNAYENGTAQDFSECYEPTWGEFKDRTKPVPGNHEYHTAEAEGYFSPTLFFQQRIAACIKFLCRVLFSLLILEAGFPQ